jgi:beta-lactam-binding protein with PASTA domain
VPQVISLTVSERPMVPQVPKLIGKKEGELKLWASDSAAQLEVVSVKSNYPAAHCCAQFPAAGSHAEGARVKAYVATVSTSHVVMPNLIGKSVQEVGQLCAEHDVALTLFHRDSTASDSHDCTLCRVIDQRPAPGSVISKNFLRAVHVQVDQEASGDRRNF